MSGDLLLRTTPSVITPPSSFRVTLPMYKSLYTLGIRWAICKRCKTVTTTIATDYQHDPIMQTLSRHLAPSRHPPCESVIAILRTLDATYCQCK